MFKINGNALRTQSVYAAHDSARKSMSLYYMPVESLAQQAAAAEVPITAWVRGGPAERAALYIIFTNAMRAGEYLRVTVGDILSNDRVLIRGEKGSAAYRIWLPGITHQFRDAVTLCPGRLVCGTTYMRVYRACLRIGIGVRKMQNVNVARTHLARYNLAEQVNGLGGRTAGDLLHHRSSKTVNSYVDARR